MESQNKENPNIDFAIQAKQKFEFYFLALVFTILGLSVQTSTITGSWQYLFETASWVMLLVSGIAGLSRLEGTPHAYERIGLQQEGKNRLEIINKGLGGGTVLRPSGKQWTEEELTKEKSRGEQYILKLEEEKNEVIRRLGWKYSMHKWCFVAGICLLLISRVVVNLNKLCISP
jgi:hypothetical protein